MVDWLIVVRWELGPDYYEAMAEILGKKAVVFTSGEEAIKWIETVEVDTVASPPASLALMNVFLDGDIRGTEVAQRLRQSPLFYNIAIVLTDTGRYSPATEREMVTNADADGFLYMPLPKFDDLQAIFSNLVERRQQYFP